MMYLYITRVVLFSHARTVYFTNPAVIGGFTFVNYISKPHGWYSNQVGNVQA